MSTVTGALTNQEVKRIGILLVGLEKINLAALKFLVLKINSLQKTFQYEFLPCNYQNEFTQMLLNKRPVDRERLKNEAPRFLDRHKEYLQTVIDEYNTKESPPDYFIIYTMAKFKDEYYTTRKGNLSVIALGNWERSMAPPSILEFFLTLTLRESIAAVSPSLEGSIHLGTKGCLCDFTHSLDEVRQKVLQGFICDFCRKSLQRDQLPNLADEIVTVLKKEWLGRSVQSHSPASIVSKLGFNLFTTKGVEPTFWETFLNLLRKEGVKQLIQIIGGLILAGLLLYLGLKAGKE